MGMSDANKIVSFVGKCCVCRKNPVVMGDNGVPKLICGDVECLFKWRSMYPFSIALYPPPPLQDKEWCMVSKFVLETEKIMPDVWILQMVLDDELRTEVLIYTHRKPKHILDLDGYAPYQAVLPHTVSFKQNSWWSMSEIEYHDSCPVCGRRMRRSDLSQHEHLVYYCDKCKQKYRIRITHEPQRIQCPNCNKEFAISKETISNMWMNAVMHFSVGRIKIPTKQKEVVKWIVLNTSSHLYLWKHPVVDVWEW